MLSCLTIVGLEGYTCGDVPCPDSTVDPVGAMNWHTNDRAIVSFLTLKASRSEQEFIAPYAAAGTRAVWDALVTRHFDATLQIRLLREVFSVRYGAEPPAVTSARIDALATRILALGPINKTTLVSAAMVNAVQGDLENFASERRRTSSSRHPQRNVDLENSAEQAAISAVATERSTLLHVLSPAVSNFLRSTQESNETEWTRLMELLFQVLGRLDAISIAPGWDQAISAKQNATAEVQKLLTSLENWVPATTTVDGGTPQAPGAGEEEQKALASIAAEMTKVRDELAPAVSNYLQQEPDDTQRKSLIGLLVQSLMRLDKTAMQAHWEGKIERRRAVEEVLRLLTTLEWSESGAGPSHNISREEQDVIARIESEMSNVEKALAPAVATFPRSTPQQTDERELKDLSRSLFDAVQRLDSTRINLDWEHARNARRNAVRAVEALQSQLDALPSCTEEQDTLKKIEAHRSHVQFLYFPAVSAYLGNPNEKERLRLSELLFQALERLDGIMLQPGWKKARAQRKEAVNEVQRLQDNLAPKSPPSYTAASAPTAPPVRPPQNNTRREQKVQKVLASERSKITLLSLAVQFYLEKPNEKERARLSDLLLQATERLDRLPVESGWEICTQEKHKAYTELQELQDKIV